MVEQEAVNFEVAGSSPVPGATHLAMCSKKMGIVLRIESSPGSHSKALRAFFVRQKVASVSGFALGTSPVL